MQKYLDKPIPSHEEELCPKELYIDLKQTCSLKKEIDKAIKRFPLRFDERLCKGLERLSANCSSGFLNARSLPHLKAILLAQFFLQKKMELSFEKEGTDQNPLFLKLFSNSSRICLAMTFLTSSRFHRDQFLKVFQHLLPGVQEIPHSPFIWHHPDLPYLFCYFEVNQLRGEEISFTELKQVEISLHKQLLTLPPLTPTLFWPYNEEEFYRQLHILLQEMRSKKDLPHISIHFQQQTPSTLEFLIHLVRPKSAELISNSFRRLPDSLHFFCHFYQMRKTPFPIELGSFSIKVPSTAFELGDSINLLYARRYASKHLEAIIGPFRDYNGGLFETQQKHFEEIRRHLISKIPHFDLFAEKVFYAIHPVETRLSLSLSKAEDLFSLFSEILQVNEKFTIRSSSENILIVKTTNPADLLKLTPISSDSTEASSHVQLTLGGYHYLCLLEPTAAQVKPISKKRTLTPESRTLRLIFQEGVPPSLNPHHSSSDMRCRLLSKLLFEGLTRLNNKGKPELAGALQYHSDKEGLHYTFKLRPCRWSNGENVTAFDYAISLESALSDHISHPELLYVIKNAREYKEGTGNRKKLGIHAVDAETLEIELEWPDPHFFYKLSQPFFFPLFGSMREPKWFNGPYVVGEQSKAGILIERNPYFWNAKGPFFEQIEIKWINQMEAISQQFHQGKIDWIGDPLSMLPSQLIHQLQLEGKLHKRSARRRFLVYFNTKHPTLRSALIRRALSISIDRSLICNEIFPYCTPLSPSLPLKEEATALFERGLKELGLTRETFPILTFSYSHQTGREQLALCLQATWQKILGINIRLEKIEWNIFRKKLGRGSFEMSGTLQDTLDAGTMEFLQRFEGPSSWNFSQWDSPAYREKLDAARQETDVKSRKNTLLQAEKILMKEAPFTPLFNYTHLFASHPQLKNFLFDQEGCVDFSQSYLKYDTDQHLG